MRIVKPCPEAEHLQHTPHMLAAFSRELAHSELLELHAHPRGQLVYAVEGVMQVRTPQGLWVIPPQRALWTPPGVPHEIRMLSKVAMRTLYIRPDACATLPGQCQLLDVSGLLRELILALLAEPRDYDEQGRGGFLAQLILSEIAAAETIPIVIPWPSDRRLINLCEAVLQQPGSSNTLEQWAQLAGASARTVIRLFPRETGLNVRHWLQQVHIAEALLRLARGETVERIAAQLGYKSASAFSAMFRSVLGTTPSQHAARFSRSPGTAQQA
jgi:AraC-like DNA-binding protein